MDCMPWCFLAMILAMSFIITMFTASTDSVFNNFKDTLNCDQIDILKSVTSERSMLFYHGLILGVVLAFIIITYLKNNINNTVTVCLSIVIILFVTYSYYILSPKKKWMLNYLETKDQINAWLEIYKVMKKRTYWGYLVGIVVYIIVSIIYLNNN